jgi:small GTP-binding protein
MQRPDYLVKIITIGNSAVGKTALAARYCHEEFIDAFISTIGVDFKIKTLQIDGLTVKLQIWDTAGQERFRAIAKTYYSRCDACMLVYDVTDKSSFNELKEMWAREVKLHTSGTNTRMVVVGNKSDLESLRMVSSEAGDSFAKEMECSFFETSCKTGSNVQAVFEHIIKESIKAKQQQPIAPRVSLKDIKIPKSKSNDCCK